MMFAPSRSSLAGVPALALLLGGHAVAGDDSNNAALREKAQQIHSRILAFDSHVDIPVPPPTTSLFGSHCAQPILRTFALYNTCADIDALIAALTRIVGGPNPSIT